MYITETVEHHQLVFIPYTSAIQDEITHATFWVVLVLQ